MAALLCCCCFLYLTYLFCGYCCRFAPHIVSPTASLYLCVHVLLCGLWPLYVWHEHFPALSETRDKLSQQLTLALN